MRYRASGRTFFFLSISAYYFLILLISAVGVDDAFVIITTWDRINKANMRLPIEERVAITMQHAGVSVTVTSFSDLVAFACGISTVGFNLQDYLPLKMRRYDGTNVVNDLAFVLSKNRLDCCREKKIHLFVQKET